MIASSKLLVSALVASRPDLSWEAGVMTLITCRVCQFWVRRKVPSPGGRVFALVKAVALDERALASAVEA